MIFFGCPGLAKKKAPPPKFRATAQGRKLIINKTKHQKKKKERETK